MALRLETFISLPPNLRSGGFDHADVHAGLDRLFVAHTCNDALDVIDCGTDRYVESIEGLTGIAGALVSESAGLVFTSNRGENTISIFTPGSERDASKVAVGVKPNGLAFDPGRNILIAANVGDPSIAGSFSVSVVDAIRKERVGDIAVPGRTRWTVYDSDRDRFYVNIMQPAKIVMLSGGTSPRVTGDFDVPAAGPHGLDLDAKNGRLFCACDAGVVYAMDAATGRVLGDIALSGSPDVIFLNSDTERLYVAVGDPGVIDVIDTRSMIRVATVPTERGSHMLALDRKRNRVFAFLPDTHRAAVFRDDG